MKRFNIDIGIETDDDSVSIETVREIANGLRKDAEQRTSSELHSATYVFLNDVSEI